MKQLLLILVAPVKHWTSVSLLSHFILSGLNQHLSRGCRISVVWAGSFMIEICLLCALAITVMDIWVLWPSYVSSRGCNFTCWQKIMNQLSKISVDIHPVSLTAKVKFLLTLLDLEVLYNFFLQKTINGGCLSPAAFIYAQNCYCFPSRRYCRSYQLFILFSIAFVLEGSKNMAVSSKFYMFGRLVF